MRLEAFSLQDSYSHNDILEAHLQVDCFTVLLVVLVHRFENVVLKTDQVTDDRQTGRAGWKLAPSPRVEVNQTNEHDEGISDGGVERVHFATGNCKLFKSPTAFIPCRVARVANYASSTRHGLKANKPLLGDNGNSCS